MLMNLNGIATTVPLYAENGTLLQQGEFQTRESEDDKLANSAFNKVYDAVVKINEQFESGLEVSQDIDLYEDEDPYYGLEVFGGNNGSGSYSEYFNILSELFKNLESELSDAWAIEMKIDSMDDVFALYIGIRI